MSLEAATSPSKDFSALFRVLSARFSEAKSVVCIADFKEKSGSCSFIGPGGAVVQGDGRPGRCDGM